MDDGAGHDVKGGRLELLHHGHPNYSEEDIPIKRVIPQEQLGTNLRCG